MEATCEENINSLKLILGNVEKPDALPFEIDVKSIQGKIYLNKYNIQVKMIIQHILNETLMISFLAIRQNRCS